MAFRDALQTELYQENVPWELRYLQNKLACKATIVRWIENGIEINFSQVIF